MKILEISQEPIKLYQIMKIENMVASGGEAKVVIAAGQVSINGIVETRKGKKIVSGDIITFGKETICVKIQ